MCTRPAAIGGRAALRGFSSLYLDLDAQLEQQQDEVDVLVLDGGYEGRAVQRVNAVDVEDLRVALVLLEQPAHGRAVAPLGAEQEVLLDRAEDVVGRRRQGLARGGARLVLEQVLLRLGGVHRGGGLAARRRPAADWPAARTARRGGNP